MKRYSFSFHRGVFIAGRSVTKQVPPCVLSFTALGSKVPKSEVGRGVGRVVDKPRISSVGLQKYRVV
jgi:hypothetical protein